uniref:C2H2-type domain-containing protein n=1 Tax=Malurus cyaneus samueli TaxID=2593467 RepID=A0A8C5UA24_9PASS
MCVLFSREDCQETCDPPGNSAAPSGKQELPAELQCRDKETCATHSHKQDENPAGEFAPSSTNLDLQSEDRDLDHRSSERKPRMITKLRADNKSPTLRGVFGEEPVPLEALQHSVECPDQACPENTKSQEDFKPYACPTCGKGFDKPNLLSKHKVIHREDKPYKCQEFGQEKHPMVRALPSSSWQGMLHHRELWNMDWKRLLGGDGFKTAWL